LPVLPDKYLDITVHFLGPKCSTSWRTFSSS